MTWAFALGRRGAVLWLGRAACAGALSFAAATACSAGSPSSSPPGDDSGGTQSTAGTGNGGSGAGVAGTGTSGTGNPAGGTTGSGGGASLTLTIAPSNNCGTPYVMDFGPTHVEVDPTQGGRVSALRVGGVDVLATQAVTGQMIDWGSTFWPSPQSWSWPPSSSIPAIDPNPYTCPASDASSFTVQSGANTGTGPKVSVSKKFSADLVKGALIIDYTMTNTGTAAAMVAPWEISRVAGGALSFYPATNPPTKNSGNFKLPGTVSMLGVTWYQDNPSDTTASKLFADGTGGWLATAVGGNVFVKKFDDVPASAQPPTEAEIEVYSSGLQTGGAAGKSYVEVENQGAYQSLAAGASVTWTVRWYARPIPAGATATAGDATLLSFVQSLVQ